MFRNKSLKNTHKTLVFVDIKNTERYIIYIIIFQLNIILGTYLYTFNIKNIGGNNSLNQN